MNSTQASGFLVSRNQYFDYRTLVAPSFMCQAGVSSLLAKVVEGDLTEAGSVFYREIHNSKVENLTLIFWFIEATAEDIGIEGNGVLKDSFGREIYLIEGFVLKEIMPDVILTQHNIEEIHQQLIEHYRKFWECIVPHSVIPSEPFILQNHSSDECLRYRILNTYIAAIDQRETKQVSVAISNSPTLVSSRDCTPHSASTPTSFFLLEWLTNLWSNIFRH